MTLKEIYHHRFFSLVVYTIYFLLFGLVVYLIDFLSKGEISNLLKKWVPWNLRINFLFLLSGILICGSDILDSLKLLLNRRGVILAMVLLIGFFMVYFVAPRTHRIFYDEDIYANIGQNIALSNQTGYCTYGTFEYDEYYPHWIKYNKQPSGWPFLISIIFQCLGTDEVYAFFLNNLLFCGSLLLVFFITWYLTGIYFTSYLSALAFALIPHNLIWANTAAAEPSASFFAGLIAVSLIVYLKTQKDRHLFLLAMILPLACQMRSESILIIFWVFLALLLHQPRILIDKKLWTLGLVTIIFLLPHLLHLYAVGGHSWGAEGAKFSLKFFSKNLIMNGTYYLNNQKFPALFTAFSIIGLFSSRCSLRWKFLILFWFLLFWGIFLFFYAGGYRYGVDVRYALVSFMPLAILAGMGGGFIREKIDSGFKIQNAGHKDSASGIQHPASSHLASGIVILVMLFSFVQFLPLIHRVGQMSWGARRDHLYAHEFSKKVPERSIILTHNPTMFLLWKRNAIQTYAGINNPGLIERLLEKYHGHVYFHYNYWCNTMSERNRRLCQAIKDRYRLKEIARRYEQDFEYVLYQMSLKK